MRSHNPSDRAAGGPKAGKRRETYRAGPRNATCGTTSLDAGTLASLAARMPLDCLLLETDSPSLTPEPHRQVKINEQQYVRAVAQFLAAKCSRSEAAFAAAADANAERFFQLS